MVGIFADRDEGHGPFGRQPALDQSRRCRRLGDAICASPAGIFRAHGDDHAQLRRHDVQPLRAVFTDLVHLPAAAWAHQAIGFDNLLDARQMFRQVTAVALGHPFALGLIAVRRGLTLLFLGLGDGNAEILEGQLPVVLVELLGLLAMQCMVHLCHKMLKALVDLFKRGHARSSRLQSLEGRAVIGRQNGEVKVFAGCNSHAANIP